MAHLCSHGVAAAIVLLFLHQYGGGTDQVSTTASCTAVKFPCIKIESNAR